MTRVIAAGVVAVVLLVTSVSGWNDKGHMAVAAVAYPLLDEPVKQRVAALLKLNPSSPWWNTRVASQPSATRAKLRFMYAALWPDDIKRESAGYIDEKKSDPGAGRNIGYEDRLQHRHWHYIDQAFSQDGTPLDQAGASAVNAQERIELFATVLGSDASDNVKSYDLVWLLHLVGDVHQPLHGATRVSTNQRQGDAGGNLHCLGRGAQCPTLHSFWDGAVGNTGDAVEAAGFAGTLNTADPGAAGNPAVSDWTRESFELAKGRVYVAPIKPGKGPSKTNGAYRTDATNLARDRISLAGARLAAILNRSLK
jgi:hypothetical protein